MQDHIATVQMFKTAVRKYNLQFYLFHTPVIFVLDHGYQKQNKVPSLMVFAIMYKKRA